MRGKILIIEDERELAELIRLYLEREGVSVTAVDSAEKGIAALEKTSFDLILLDINLPGMDGFEFLQEIRKNNQIPVLITSARESDEDIILGLGSGADEFITKPFSPKVLVARIRAFLRRIKQNNSDSDERIVFGDFEVFPGKFLCTRAGDRVPLSSREFEVLVFLLKNREKAMSVEHIYLSVWGDQYGDTSTVAVYIQRIRKKIEPDPANPQYIKTIHGRGYRFSIAGGI